MSFMFRKNDDEIDLYPDEISFEKDELKQVHDYYDFLGSYIHDKEDELKRLYAERKAALFTLKKFGVKV